MTGMPDELVEKAARALAAEQNGDRYWTTEAESYRAAWREKAIRVVDDYAIVSEAVGLPALLERVEAAEGEVVMALRMHDVQYERANRIQAERDAHAALTEGSEQ